MQSWIISANTNLYDHFASFSTNGFINWRQVNSFQVGDIVFIYCTKPYKKIVFKTVVEKINQTVNNIVDDKKFWLKESNYNNQITQNYKYTKLKLMKAIDSPKLCLEELRNNGYTMNGGPQRGLKLNKKLSDYIDSCFETTNEIPNSTEEYSPCMLGTDEEIDTLLSEGKITKVYVNRYERSSEARNKCLESNGYICKICGFDFESVYGELGKGFIHVHHKVPLSEINDAYYVDYKNDLIPVCPNCHAMLHRKLNGEEVSVDLLKYIVEEHK
jgi:HNH endonuclease